MEEIWKDIKNYEGLYQVSNFGRVKSLKRIVKPNRIIEEKILIPSIKKHKNNAKSYNILLCKNNTKKYCSISRLVYTTFHDIELKNTEIVKHKDKNPTNHNLDNLYIDTRETFGNRLFFIELNKSRAKKYKYYEKEYTLKELCETFGIDFELLKARLRYGWNIYEAMEIPKCERIRK